MVDPGARAIAAALLERFLRNEVSNDDLEVHWPTSPDPALEPIGLAVWTSYDDLTVHHGPTSAIPLVQRCAAFLRTNEEYTGPTPKPWLMLLALPVSLLTLGHSNRLFWREFERPRWPFAK